MADRHGSVWVRAAEAAPGYLAVIAGAAVLSAMVLAPAHASLERTRWERAVMRVQAEHLSDLAERYRDFHEALEAGEPVLLERLAYAQLRLRPAHKRSLPAVERSQPGGGETADASGVSARSLEDPADIHAWLSRPLPRVGREIAPHRPAGTRLARLASGRSRVGLTVAGGVLVFGGLLWGRSGASG